LNSSSQWYTMAVPLFFIIILNLYIIKCLIVFTLWHCDYLIWFTVTGTRPDDEVSLTHEFVIWDEIFTAYKFCCNWTSLTVIDNRSPDRNWKQWANLPESNPRSRPRTGTWFVILTRVYLFLSKSSTYYVIFSVFLFLFSTWKKRLSGKLIHDWIDTYYSIYTNFI